MLWGEKAGDWVVRLVGEKMEEVAMSLFLFLLSARVLCVFIWVSEVQTSGGGEFESPEKQRHVCLRCG